jgi:glycosyltransferase involved in cell wall biosynthesis
LKVLHLLGAGSYLPWQTGGSIIYCHRLCQRLAASGVDVKVAVHQTPDKDVPVGEYKHENIPVVVLPPIPDFEERVSLYSRTTRNATGFRELLERFQPDIVHFHDFSYVAGITHMHLAKEASCKIVLTYHTPGNSCPQHGLLYRGNSICDGRILLGRCTECRLSDAGMSAFISTVLANFSIPWLKSEAKNKIARIFTSRRMTELFLNSWKDMIMLTDIIIVCAEWVKRLLNINGVEPEKIIFCPQGTLIPNHKIYDKTQSRDSLFLAFAGRSTRIKGVHVIAEAMRLLPPLLPVKATLFLASKNWEEDEYGRDVERQISDDQRFEVKYCMPNSQLIDMLSVYDATIVPSIWPETGPLVVFESFAAGVPVIGSRLGGIEENVRDGIDGILFKAGDAKELAGVIRRLLEDRGLLARLKSNIRPQRSMADVAVDMTKIYTNLSDRLEQRPK